MALGGGAYAVSLAKNSVKSKQIKDGAVRSQEIRDGEVALADTAAALRLRCPPPTLFVEGACLEPDARNAAADWFTAQQTCLSAGRRLPSVAELQVARLEVEIEQVEWASALDSAPPGVRAAAVTGAGAVATDPIGDLHRFRCVAPPLR